MSVEPKPENPMKAAVSVSSLCRLLRMSRSQFYFHVKRGTKAEPKKPKADHSSLLEGLALLGLNGVTQEQIEAALAACFPKGTTGHDEASVLRAVLRHLKRSGTA